MTEKIIPSLLTLPVDLIHRILDNLSDYSRDGRVKPFFESSRVESSTFSNRVESSQVESPAFSSRVESSQDIFAIFSFSVYFYNER